jgi:hypothetical protein
MKQTVENIVKGKINQKRPLTKNFRHRIAYILTRGRLDTIHNCYMKTCYHVNLSFCALVYMLTEVQIEKVKRLCSFWLILTVHLV